MLREEERASITGDIYGIIQLSIIGYNISLQIHLCGFLGKLSPSGTHPMHSRRRRVVRILFGFTGNLDSTSSSIYGAGYDDNLLVQVVKRSSEKFAKKRQYILLMTPSA